MKSIKTKPLHLQYLEEDYQKHLQKLNDIQKRLNKNSNIEKEVFLKTTEANKKKLISTQFKRFVTRSKIQNDNYFIIKHLQEIEKRPMVTGSENGPFLENQLSLFREKQQNLRKLETNIENLRMMKRVESTTSSLGHVKQMRKQNQQQPPRLRKSYSDMLHQKLQIMLNKHSSEQNTNN